MAESRTSKAERRALERVARRATAHRNWSLVESLYLELGLLLLLEAEEALLPA